MRFNSEHFGGFEGFVMTLTAGSLRKLIVLCHFLPLRLYVDIAFTWVK